MTVSIAERINAKRMDDAYYREVDEILQHFDVKGDVGLDEERVEEQRKNFGWNGTMER